MSATLRAPGTEGCRIERVREDYLWNNGVTQAIKHALQALFSEPRLPDNPYYFLSSVLGAYVDQSPLWLESNDALIVSPYDLEGTCNVVQPANQLCGHSSTSNCFGLPHVIRLVSREGVDTLNQILSEGVPDTFFPSSTPFITKDGCTVQLLSSIQGMCAVWRPTRTGMPEIQVRTDVLVRGARLEDAVTVFLDAVLTAVEDMAEVPVYFVDGLSIHDAPSQVYEGLKQPFDQFYYLTDILTNCEEWERTAKRLVLGGRCISMRCALLLDAHMISSLPDAANTSHTQTGNSSSSQAGFSHTTRRFTADISGSLGPEATVGPHQTLGQDPLSQNMAAQPLRYHMATRTFYFHYASLETSKVAYDQLQHYGTIPFDALFNGYFPTLSSAASYLAMWQVDDTSPPYAVQHLDANINSLKRQVARELRHGDSLQAFQQLMYLVMLQDPAVTSPSPLDQSSILPLEDLVCGGSGTQGAARRKAPAAAAAGRGGAGQRQAGGGRGGQGRGRAQVQARQAGVFMTGSSSVFGVIPNLMRLLSSAAALIQGVTRELEAINIAASSWPSKLARIQASAAIIQGKVYVQRPDGLYTSPDTGDSRRTLRTPEVSTAMLSWLGGFDMEGRLLSQLVSSKERITAVVGRGLFAGVSILCGVLLSMLPDQVPTTRTAQLMHKLQPVISQLVQLLKVGSMTVSRGFLGRCANITQVMRQLGVDRVSLLDSRVMDTAAPAGSTGPVPPDDPDEALQLMTWSLDVSAAVGAQVQGGSIPGRVGIEGVALQYAVDCQLDDALKTIWLQVSQPPQPLNPFPKLMHLIRSRAAKMELWREESDDVLHSLMSELVLLPPSWLYAARASQEAVQARKRVMRSKHYQAESEARVYGSYAAVALANADLLQCVGSSLSDLLTERHWQHGAYQGEVIPCLSRDCSLSAALEDEAALVAAAALRAAHPAAEGMIKAVPSASAGELPLTDRLRFTCLTGQIIHLVEGPSRSQAAQAFAHEVVRSLLSLHTSTPHILHRLEVYLPAGCAESQAVRTWRTGHTTTSITGPAPFNTAAHQQHLTSNTSLVHSPSPSLPHTNPTSSAGHIPGQYGTRGSLAVPATPAGDDQESDADSAAPAFSVVRHQPVQLKGEAGQLLVRVRFWPSDLVMEASRQLVLDALVAATKSVTQGQPLACVQVYAATTADITYISLKQDLVFQHAKAAPPLRPNQAMAVSAVPPVAQRPSTAQKEGMYWDTCMYERVFLSERAAMTWWRWNSLRGDPAQPFHQQHLLSELLSATRSLSSRGRLVEAHKTALMGAIAVQDDAGIYELSRSCCSAAQDLAALLDLNQALVDLLSESGGCDAASWAKRDNERLRKMLLTYTSRTRRVLCSPRSCYFSSLAEMAQPMLEGLKQHVLSAFNLGPSQLFAMEQLAVWTRACEVSCAAALHDCFSEPVRTRWLAGTGAAGSGSAGSAGSAGYATEAGTGGGGSLLLRPASASSVGRRPASGRAVKPPPYPAQEQEQDSVPNLNLCIRTQAGTLRP